MKITGWLRTCHRQPLARPVRGRALGQSQCHPPSVGYPEASPIASPIADLTAGPTFEPIVLTQGEELTENEMAREEDVKDKDKPLYMISVVAELLSIHPQTLRLYEREGFISPRSPIGAPNAPMACAISPAEIRDPVFNPE